MRSVHSECRILLQYWIGSAKSCSWRRAPEHVTSCGRLSHKMPLRKQKTWLAFSSLKYLWHRHCMFIDQGSSLRCNSKIYFIHLGLCQKKIFKGGRCLHTDTLLVLLVWWKNFVRSYEVLHRILGPRAQLLEERLNLNRLTSFRRVLRMLADRRPRYTIFWDR